MGWLGARVYDLVMRAPERRHIAAWRRNALQRIGGEVLEIGAGTGANEPYYAPTLKRLVLLEPDPHMRAKLLARLKASGRLAEVGDAKAENLPFADESFDWVVSTLVLCSVQDPQVALGEIRRVLRPGGSLAFVEHVLDPEDARNRRRQKRYQPLWGLLAAHCQVTRDTRAAIASSGFEFANIEDGRMTMGPRIVRPMIWGEARR